MTRTVNIFLTAVLLLLLAACGNGNQSTDQGKVVANSPTVATVDGKPISQALLDAYLRARNEKNPNAKQRRDALKELINLELLKQAAEESGVADKPEVRADLALQAASALATRQVQAQLAKEPVTEEEAKNEYETQRTRAGLKEYHLRHILLPTKREAQEVIVALNKGAKFDKLADERSVDKREHAGGDLGWVNLTQLPDAMAEAVKKIHLGAYNQEPVQTRFGWHVIKVVDTRELKPPSFDQVKKGIYASLQRQRTEAYVESLRSKADIKMLKSIAEPDEAAAPDSAQASSGKDANGPE